MKLFNSIPNFIISKQFDSKYFIIHEIYKAFVIHGTSLISCYQYCWSFTDANHTLTHTQVHKQNNYSIMLYLSVYMGLWYMKYFSFFLYRQTACTQLHTYIGMYWHAAESHHRIDSTIEGIFQEHQRVKIIHYVNFELPLLWSENGRMDGTKIYKI